MNIRDLAGIDNLSGISVDGIPVRQILKSTQGYQVWLGNGDCIQAKGHDRIEDLKRFKQVGSHDRIRRYGEFGSTIN